MAGSIPLHCSLNNTLDRNDKSEHTPQLGECSSDYHCLSGGFIPDISVSPPESNLLRWPLIQKRGARERTDDVLLFRRNKNTSEQSILYSDVVRLKGFEPPTYWFVASHSIQLSYRHTFPTLIIISQIFMYVNVFFVLQTKLCKILKKIHIISTLVAYMYIFPSSKNFP